MILSYEPEKDFKTVRSSQLKRNRNLAFAPQFHNFSALQFPNLIDRIR